MNSGEAAPASRRHGCLTAVLAYMLITNIVMAIAMAMTFPTIKKAMPNLSTGMLAIIIFGMLADIVFTIAIIKWKRWGFYGYIAVSAVCFIASLSGGASIIQSALGLIGIPLLYWVMNMGGPNKAWPHIK